MYTHMTSLAISRASGKRHRCILFGPLSRCFRAGDPLPRKRLVGSEKTIHCESSLLLLLRVFYFTALSVNCRRIGSSTGSPACCAPSGDELLLSRASRSRGLTLFGLSSRERVRPRKAQIAKNNIAVDGEKENNRIDDAGGCDGDGDGDSDDSGSVRGICIDLSRIKSYSIDINARCCAYLAIMIQKRRIDCSSSLTSIILCQIVMEVLSSATIVDALIYSLPLPPLSPSF